MNTEYSYDFLGNKVEKTEDGDVRKYHYNKYNQLTNITTKEGITDIYYDKNGNMENILYAGGQKEHYDYDEFGQLTKVTSTKDQSYEFSYDAEGDRIQYVKNVRDEYDDKTWYNYLEGLEFEEVKDLLEDKNSDDTFDSLVYQSQYHIETGSCVYPPEYSDADWYRKDIKYAVDKSLEFSEVLFTSTGDVNIYGNGERLYTKNGMNKTTYINGLNKSVYETVDMKFDFYGCRETSKEYSYTDTGYSKKHKFGYGYNGEALDDTGLIYLRARYYNVFMGQFVQLDTYKGEQNSIESQNRYSYVLNNAYKYIDKDGHKVKKKNIKKSKKESKKEGDKENGKIFENNEIYNPYDVDIMQALLSSLRDIIAEMIDKLNKNNFWSNTLEGLDFIVNAETLNEDTSPIFRMFECTIHNTPTTYDPRPLSGGTTFEKQQKSTKPAPAYDDEDAWQLQSIIRYTKMQLDDIKNKLAAIFDIGFLVAGLVTGGTGFLVASAKKAVVSGVIQVMRTVGNTAFDLLSFKDELSYIENYTLIDGYNSTMSCTIYFGKNSVILGKSNPFIFTN